MEFNSTKGMRVNKTGIRYAGVFGQLICQFLQDNILEDVPLWAAGLTVW
jgi:hypothetical protein